MNFKTEMLKGVAVYEIRDASDNMIARAHRIHVGLNLYSLVIGGKPAARGAEALVVKTMQGMVAKANA